MNEYYDIFISYRRDGGFETALKSEYVQKERLQALERAFPQVKPERAATLRIYPMSIEPRAELPEDMKDNYHFGEI